MVPHETMETTSPADVSRSPAHTLGERKVFCVGFNKSGTTTLHRVFADQLGMRSAHNPRWTDWSVARMTDPLDRHQVYSDGGCASVRNLDELYPDALFILNTRPLRNWVLSRHKAVERSRAAVRWFLSRYVPLGWLARVLNRVIMDNGPRAMARWVAIRNAYHRHVLEYFDGREDKLLVLDIENDDAYERLTRFLGTPAKVQPPVANADGQGSTTNVILNAIGKRMAREQSTAVVQAFFEVPELAPHADCLTYFESGTYRLGRSASDVVLVLLPFLRVPFRWTYRAAVGQRAGARSFFAKWFWDLFIRFFRSERDMDHFTTVTRTASGSK